MASMFEFSHLRTFVAVASELHFGRASARLNLPQPAVSRQIRHLEEILGTELFVRTSRSVQLTSAGHAFSQTARRLIEGAEAALNEARQAAHSHRGTLSIGLIGAATYQVLPRIARALRERLPQVELSFREMLTSEQIEALATHGIDVGLGRPPSGVRGLAAIRVAREPLILAVPQGHPLVSLPQPRLQHIGSHPFIAYEPDPGGLLFRLLEEIFLAVEPPNIVQRVRQTQTVLSLVSAGIGVALVPHTAQYASFAGVVFRPVDIPGNPQLDMHAIWRPENDNPMLPPFRNVLARVFEEGVG
jgi:DNA-binding transcriptional LysR family regulator